MTHAAAAQKLDSFSHKPVHKHSTYTQLCSQQIQTMNSPWAGMWASRGHKLWLRDPLSTVCCSGSTRPSSTAGFKKKSVSFTDTVSSSQLIEAAPTTLFWYEISLWTSASDRLRPLQLVFSALVGLYQSWLSQLSRFWRRQSRRNIDFASPKQNFTAQTATSLMLRCLEPLCFTRFCSVRLQPAEDGILGAGGNLETRSSFVH